MTSRISHNNHNYTLTFEDLNPEVIKYLQELLQLGKALGIVTDTRFYCAMELSSCLAEAISKSDLPSALFKRTG